MDELILDANLAEHKTSLENVKFAGFWIRVGASLIDALVMLPIIGLSTYNSLNIKSLPLMLLLSVIAFLYKPYLEWKKSATLGKLAVGIRVVDYSMNNISLDQAIKRYFPWIGSFLISMTINLILFTSEEFKDVDEFLELGLLIKESPINSISSIYNFVFIIVIGAVIFDKRKQGFHDKYAETYCIK